MTHTPVLVVEDQPGTPWMTLRTRCVECNLEIARTDVDVSRCGINQETADWAGMRGEADGEAWLRHIAGGR